MPAVVVVAATSVTDVVAPNRAIVTLHIRFAASITDSVAVAEPFLGLLLAVVSSSPRLIKTSQRQRSQWRRWPLLYLKSPASTPLLVNLIPLVSPLACR